MIEFYSQIRIIHIWAISLSGFLFFTRAGFSFFGYNWPHFFSLRMLSWVIDFILLTAAAMLCTILPKEMFENGWLHVKITLVVLYILSGFGAMRKKFSKPIRIGFYIIAGILFAMIIGIARAKSPIGWFY
ncbi:MAG: SirB2 family protein [Caulobacterales bacterium]|nr:SirB2 family protein [Caulobacterales bacterium]